MLLVIGILLWLVGLGMLLSLNYEAHKNDEEEK